MRLAGKVALITGAAGGIGRATARRFAQEGAAIVAADIDDVALAETVELVAGDDGRDRQHRRIVGLVTDVTEPADVARAVGTAEERFGHLDVVFNNAGVMLPADGDALSTDVDTIDRTLAINVKGVLLGCKHAIPALRRAGGGSIINTASFVATLGAATAQIAYTASKGAVLSLTRELAVVHARESIRVNALSPGPLHTDMLMKLLDSEDKRQRRLLHIPIGRFGYAEEIAHGALFLASDESSFVTGSNLVIDGGITAAYVTPD
jgi:NAD(P)-dependent dehydrogenase (short-subunit alcohol dehydrogenase family)